MANATGYVDAVYVGPPGLPSGLEVVPGETVVALPEGEAKASKLWEPKGKTSLTEDEVVAQTGVGRRAEDSAGGAGGPDLPHPDYAAFSASEAIAGITEDNAATVLGYEQAQAKPRATVIKAAQDAIEARVERERQAAKAEAEAANTEREGD